MIVPDHWAEGSHTLDVHGKPVTVRRFGWSDDSQAAAQAHADARARDAAVQIASGGSLPRREPKRAYNGADGMPIREEVVQREGDIVVTRNSYGALCLNTPDVLFVDIDFEEDHGWAGPNGGALPLALIAGTVVAAGATWTSGSWFAAVVTAALLAALVTWFLSRRRQATGEETVVAVAPEDKPLSAADRALQRVARFAAQHPDWHLRVYRTPAGLRVLVMHRTFAADEKAVEDCFHLLGADKVYVRMCRHQHCFRARLTPKPWRIGIASHLKPRPGVWPVAADRLEARRVWLAQYDAEAGDFAACAFLQALGPGDVHPSARAVQELHDRLSGATSGLAIA